MFLLETELTGSGDVNEAARSCCLDVWLGLLSVLHHKVVRSLTRLRLMTFGQ